MSKCKCGCGKDAPLRKKGNKRLGKVKGTPADYCHGHRITTPILEKYTIDSNGCWLWGGCLTKDGYGKIQTREKPYTSAHRYFYEKKNGAIPADKIIDHLCRNRRCVNPCHMELVSNTENIRRGLRAKLTPNDVSIIKRRIINGEKQSAIATEYHVDPVTINCIKKGKSWKDIAPAVTEAM